MSGDDFKAHQEANALLVELLRAELCPPRDSETLPTTETQELSAPPTGAADHSCSCVD